VVVVVVVVVVVMMMMMMIRHRAKSGEFKLLAVLSSAYLVWRSRCQSTAGQWVVSRD
jgi:hypothetical protein